LYYLRGLSKKASRIKERTRLEHVASEAETVDEANNVTPEPEPEVIEKNTNAEAEVQEESSTNGN
ncbi:MAG: 50S ribosomal protein L19, partial [Candidatus Dadabacteria bacterium]|nr:50S ribosomal protein L19 [Candidatus Dadabacteria bacterium]